MTSHLRATERHTHAGGTGDSLVGQICRGGYTNELTRKLSNKLGSARCRHWTRRIRLLLRWLLGCVYHCALVCIAWTWEAYGGYPDPRASISFCMNILLALDECLVSHWSMFSVPHDCIAHLNIVISKWLIHAQCRLCDHHMAGPATSSTRLLSRQRPWPLIVF